MTSARTVVGLTIATAVVAGMLFAVATVWHTRDLSESYDDAFHAELEQKAYASAFTVKAFLDELGPGAAHRHP